jgi:ATP-dependent Clp protease protease subunit
MALMPMVIEREGNGERAMDLNSRLLKERIIKVSSHVEPVMADIITSELLFLEAEDPNADIFMYINSPGGEVVSGMAIYDVMQYIKPDVHTIVNGMAASMGSVLLMAGAKGKRSAMPNAEIMIHQPSGGSQGKASDMEISWEHMKRTKEKMHDLYVKHTNMEYDEVVQALDRDTWLTPEEALRLGIIDNIIQPRS